MHLYDAIEEYNFEHGKHFDPATGQYDLLMPHDLGRPLTHEEMDYNFLYQKQTMNGFRIFGSGANLRLNDDDTDKVLKFHKIDPADDNYIDYTTAGYVTGQWIWIPEELAAPPVVTYVSLTATPSVINETNNNTTTFTLTTINVTDNTVVDWSIATNGSITAGDFIGGLTGQATIIGDTATWTVQASADAITEGPEVFTLTLAATDSALNDTTTFNGGNPLSADVTITDTSLTPQYISIDGNNSVAEGQQIGFGITTANFFQAATVNWEIDFASSTATAADFTGATSGVINMTSSGLGIFTVTTASDLVVDAGETFIVKLVGSDSNGVPTNGISKTVTITDVVFPTYTSFTGPNSVVEGNSVTYILSGTNVPNGTQVGYTIAGINGFDINDTDLLNLSGNITMNNGSGTLSFNIPEDFIVENGEEYTITLNGIDSAGNSTGLPMSKTTSISDAASTYTIDGDAQIVEGETKTYTFKATNMTPGTTVYWELRNYAAGDYVDFATDIVSPRTGNGQVVTVGNEVHLTFDIEVSNDYTSAEGDEYLKIVVWDDAANYDIATPNFDTAVSGALATKNITVVDLAPEWQLTTVSNNQAEPEVLTFNILTRYVPVGTPFTWEAKAYGANPAAAADFDGGNWPTGSGTVSTFNNIVALDSQFTTSVIADNTTENDPEQYILELSDANGVVASKIINITDNSQTPPPIVYDIQVSPLSIVEDTNAQYMEFTLTATQANGNIPPAGTTIGYTIDGDWDVNDIEVIGVVGAGNHASEPFPVIVSGPANPYTEVFKLDTNGQAAIRVYGTYDQLVENGEDVTVTVDANDSAGNVTGGVSATGTINDSAAQVWQISGPASQNEGSTLTFEVKTQNVPAQAYTYQIVASGSSPANAADFQGSSFPSGSGNIAQLNTTISTDGTHDIIVVNDFSTEGAETYTIELYNAASNLVASKQITINDTSVTPAYLWGPYGNPNNENGGIGYWATNDEGTTYQWQLAQWSNTTIPAGQQIWWRVEINNISNPANPAQAADFSGGVLPSGNFVTQTAGTVGDPNTVALWSVTINADTITDGVERYDMKLYTDNTYTTELQLTGANQNYVRVTINDTSQTPTYNTITAQTVNEGQNMTFTLSTANVANGTTVGFTFTGTAASGTDYTLPGAAQMTINNNSATYTITTIADQITENASETVIMTLNATDSNGFGTNSIQGTGTINDTSLSPIFDCGDAGLTINAGITGQTVTGSVANGTLVGSFNPPTYQSGNQSYSIDITVPAVDSNGNAYSNAGVDIPCSANAAGTNPTFALTNNGPVNEGQNITWTLTTTNVANGTTVPFTLSGTASSPQDYSNIQPFEFDVQNNTATYTVATFADNLTDISNPETVIVTLAANDSAGNATGGISSTANINDTSQTPTYNTITAQTVNEGQNMTFTLSTANVANGTTVGFTFTGTAASGTDYTLPGAAQMTINNNSATYTIATVADQITESGPETVIMTLNATDSNGFGTDSITGTGTINDTSQAPQFDCADAQLSVINGTVGDPVNAVVVNGAIASINPQIYQSGTGITYTAQITAPPTDGNGVAYGNAGQNIACTDTADGNAPTIPMYWTHIGAGGFPYLTNQLNPTGAQYYYEATGGLGGPGVGYETTFAPIFEDMIANPNQWTQWDGTSNSLSMNDGDTFAFPGVVGVNGGVGPTLGGGKYYFIIPDSFGIPDLTTNAKLSTNGGQNDIAVAKGAITLNGIAYTMYEIGSQSESPITVQYNA